VAASEKGTDASFFHPFHPELSNKQLPPVHSFCSLAGGNLVVSAVKKAERDGAIVLRVFEAEGAAAQTPVEFLGRKHAGISVDGEVEPPVAVHSGLPNIVSLVVLLGTQGGLLKVLRKQPDLLVKSSLHLGRSSTVISPRPLGVEPLHRE
jgi:hypothetical protein